MWIIYLIFVFYVLGVMATIVRLAIFLPDEYQGFCRGRYRIKLYFLGESPYMSHKHLLRSGIDPDFLTDTQFIILSWFSFLYWKSKVY